jgi:WD40 repeat protein
LERVRDILFTLDGNSVLATAGDQIRQFEAATGEERWSYTIPRAWGFLIISALSLAISDSNLFAASTDNGQIFVWDGQRNLIAKHGTNQPQRGLTFIAGTEELIGYEGFAANRYDARTGAKTGRFPLPDKAYAMAVSLDGQTAAVRTLSHVFILDAHNGKIKTEMRIRPGLPLLAFHPSEPIVAIGEDNFVALIGLDGNSIDDVRLESAEVISLAFNPNGQELSIGCSDHQILRHPIL